MRCFGCNQEHPSTGHENLLVNAIVLVQWPARTVSLCRECIKTAVATFTKLARKKNGSRRA